MVAGSVPHILRGVLDTYYYMLLPQRKRAWVYHSWYLTLAVCHRYTVKRSLVCSISFNSPGGLSYPACGMSLVKKIGGAVVRPPDPTARLSGAKAETGSRAVYSQAVSASRDNHVPDVSPVRALAELLPVLPSVAHCLALHFLVPFPEVGVS